MLFRSPPPPIEIDGEPEYKLEEIINSRLLRNKLQYRAKWTGYSPEHDTTWYLAENFENASITLEQFHSRYPRKPRLSTRDHYQVNLRTSPVKGEKTPTPPPATAQEGWNDNRFLPSNATPSSLSYSGSVEMKEQRRAKKAALHRGLSWTACYEDHCPVHLDAKQRQDWFPKQLSKKGKEPARDMEWETAYDAEPGSDWVPPTPTKKERRAHKDLVKWRQCLRDNCSVHRWEKVEAGYYTQMVGKCHEW